ncbi:peptidyl-tRNA hydrolase [Yamadazyma tenuis]|nr:peptidyl-tRNA hydrolase [Yamadazyma tenuis]
MVASIGNPEPDYSGSRHSVGHWVLEQLVQNHWKNFSRFQKHRNISRGPYSVSQDSVSSNVLLFKSNETYMNLQGEPIHANWSEVRRIQSRQFSPALVVVHDEISLPLGKIQIRKQGSSPRGHNGLRSIDKIMGQNYTKIAVGVGKPPNKYVADFVLAKFKRPEVEVLEYDVMPQIVQVLEQMTKGEHIFEVSKAPEKRQRQPRPRQNTKKDSISEVVESAASTASS